MFLLCVGFFPVCPTFYPQIRESRLQDMYKTVMIDTDPTELHKISNMIDWDTCGLEIAGLFTDSSKALHFLKANHADILITNIYMPQTDGIQLLQALRSEGMDIRCVFLSDQEAFHLVQKAIPLGIENFLIKPVDPQILQETLYCIVQKLAQEHPINNSLHSTAEDSSQSRSYPPILINHTFEKLMMNQEYQLCLDYLDNLFSHASAASGITPTILRNHVVELAVYILNVLRSYNINVADILEDDSAIYNKIIHLENTEELYVWIKDFLTKSVQALESQNMRFSPCIARAVAHIEKNYPQDISLKTMAYDLNINAAYLGQLFKAETGQLFSVFLNKIRIENAQKMLLQSTLTLNDISMRCGYTNISYFYNIFKKHTGQTPSQYRKAKAK